MKNIKMSDFDIAKSATFFIESIKSIPETNRVAPKLEPDAVVTCYKYFVERLREISKDAPIASGEICLYITQFKDNSNSLNPNFDALQALSLLKNLCAELEINESIENYESLLEFKSLLSKTILNPVHQRITNELSTEFLQKLISSYRPQNQEAHIKNVKSEIDDASSAIQTLKTFLENLKTESIGLSDRLKFLNGETGFVELNEAFKSLRAAKDDELKKKTKVKWSIVAVIFGLLFLELISLIALKANGNILENSIMGLPVFTALLILIYLFRLTYREEDAVRSQILQIDLRMSLIRFLKSYSDHASELKDKDKRGTELEKFESIIFSNIAPNQEKMPGAFDGVDDLIKLLKASK